MLRIKGFGLEVTVGCSPTEALYIIHILEPSVKAEGSEGESALIMVSH